MNLSILKPTMVASLALGIATLVPCQADTIFVSNAAGGTIQSYDTTNGDLVGSISTAYGPLGITFDSSGNLYALGGNGQLYKYAGGTGTPTVVATGVPNPAGITTNGTNFYAAKFDNPAGGVSTITPGGTVSPLATSYLYTNNLAFHNGDLYITNMNGTSGADGSVNILNPTTGTEVGSPIETSLNHIEGLAFNSAGDLYLSGRVNGASSISQIQIYTLQSGVYTYSSTLDNETANANLNDPYSLTFDSAGNLFVASLNAQKILEYTGGTGTASVFADSSDGLNIPAFLAIQPAAAPEPSTWALLVAGVAGLFIVRRKVSRQI